MNERIRELVEQARQYAWVNETHWSAGPERERLFEQKFAELIVREILAITDAHTEVFQTDRDRALVEHIKQSVKQHFGVE